MCASDFAFRQDLMICVMMYHTIYVSLLKLPIICRISVLTTIIGLAH